MSCCNTCNVNPCNCQYTVVLPDNPVVGYSAANINLTGVGVFSGTNGTEFDFRGITSANNALLVTLDAGNNTILLTFNIQQIIDDLPNATISQRGVLETATDAEAQGKVLLTKILTPSNLAALGATSSFAGLIETATDPEAIAGVLTTVAITPANLAAVLSGSTAGTRVFADAVARASAIPDFDGQFGYQLDTNGAYVSFGVLAGEWSLITGLFDPASPGPIGGTTPGNGTFAALNATSATIDNGYITLDGNYLAITSPINLQGNSRTLSMTAGNVSFAGAVTTVGADATVITVPAGGSIITLPSSGTLATTAGLFNPAIPGPIGGTTPSTGAFTAINAGNATVTTGTFGFITSSGQIECTGDGVSINTSGIGSAMGTSGVGSDIYTSGSASNIYTTQSDSYIQSAFDFRLLDVGSGNITTIGHAPTGNRSIVLPNTNGTLVTTAQAVSTVNTQTGYTNFTNPATIRTLDTATATLQQVAQCLGTLIADLRLVKLPSV